MIFVPAASAPQQVANSSCPVFPPTHTSWFYIARIPPGFPPNPVWWKLVCATKESSPSGSSLKRRRTISVVNAFWMRSCFWAVRRRCPCNRQSPSTAPRRSIRAVFAMSGFVSTNASLCWHTRYTIWRRVARVVAAITTNGARLWPLGAMIPEARPGTARVARPLARLSNFIGAMRPRSGGFSWRSGLSIRMRRCLRSACCMRSKTVVRCPGTIAIPHLERSLRRAIDGGIAVGLNRMRQRSANLFDQGDGRKPKTGEQARLTPRSKGILCAFPARTFRQFNRLVCASLVCDAALQHCHG